MAETSGTTSPAEIERQALQLEREQRFEEARHAFDAALNLNPSSQTSAEGRARVALALREADGVRHCARALAFHDAHPERQLRMIGTAASAFGHTAIPLFEEYLGRHPRSAAAHEMLAELRAEGGAGDFTEDYVSALRDYPNDKPLLMSFWNTLTRAGRLDEALESMDANRSLFEGDRDFAMLEVNIANHAGLTDRSSKLLENLDDRPDAKLARGLNRLQLGLPDQAAELLESVVAALPDNLEAWSLLELAWRITGNPRHAWLVGQPPLYGCSDLDLDPSQLTDIAASLRTMHQATAQPLGQSVRGGTQTPGQLFLRHEPEIKLLHDALVAAIRQFVENLPAPDPLHPLLKHRDMGMAFGPSWSVRFTGSGHHAAHFHPGGILSSACYIVVPETLTDEEEKPGWLEIGRPPIELGLDLPPLATIEPKPGRLVLFPSFLFHGTRPFTGGERLSVAFDLVPVPMR
jgi:tetratricopeptide (TPR) repeat protein